MDVYYFDWTVSPLSAEGALAVYFEETHWAHEHEQVWIHGTRYIVIRVEHRLPAVVNCFVKEIN